MEEIVMTPIGHVSNDVVAKKDVAWGEDVSRIVIDQAYTPGLKGIEDFSHAIVLFHLNQAAFVRERHLQRRPQNREDMPVVGIFAQRCKDRPNHMGVTSVEIVSVDGDTLVVRGLDAINDTPVLDIKPYFPAYDRRDARVPEWADRLMEHYF